MQTVNYDAISTIYDEVRHADVDLIQHFILECDLNPTTRVLDLGCGTGNYLDLFQRLSLSEFYGVEPSVGMGQNASQKNKNLTISIGNAYNIPFRDNCFDFIYMTDVIHHIPDLSQMFDELFRILKSHGRVCIVTQSHQQIEQRPIARFFPETVTVDQARYPTIDNIIQAATTFIHLKNVQIQVQTPITLDDNFLDLVRKKGYSMLHLISESAYEQGLAQLEQMLQHADIETKSAGSTLVWLQKI